MEVCFTLIFWDASYFKLPKNVEVSFSLVDCKAMVRIAQDSVNFHQRDDTLQRWCVQWVASCHQGLGGGAALWSVVGLL